MYMCMFDYIFVKYNAFILVAHCSTVRVLVQQQQPQ